MVRTLFIAIGISLFLNSAAFADYVTFSVTICGALQDKQGLPIITIPETYRKASELTNVSDSRDFYVVVKNISHTEGNLIRYSSDVYSAISFEIKMKSQTIYVSRPTPSSVSDRMESWRFRPNGIRVFVINFCTSPWEIVKYDANGQVTSPQNPQAGSPFLPLTDAPSDQPIQIRAYFEKCVSDWTDVSRN